MSAAELTTNDTEQEQDRALASRRARARRLRAIGRRAPGEPGDVDLHDAIDLLRNGCSPDLALKILL